MKKTKAKLGLLISVLAATVVGSILILAHAAAGSATLTLTSDCSSCNIGSTVNVTIHESSTDQINLTQADLIYDQSKLQFLGIDQSGSTFDTPAIATGGGGAVSVVRGVSGGGTVTGPQTLAKVSFKVLVGSGTTSITFASSSDIENPSIQPPADSNVWNRATTGGTYTLTTPPPTCAAGQTGTYPNCVTPTAGSTGGSTGTGSSSGSKTSTGTRQSTPAATSPSAATQAADPSVPIVVAKASNSGQGYLVAIKVLDPNGKILGGATVTVDNKTTTSDKTGIATFVNVPAGAHTVSVKSPQGTVKSAFTVSDQKAPAELQTFTLKVKRKSVLPLVFEIGVGIIVLSAIAAVLRLWRRKKLLSFPLAPKSAETASPAIDGASTTVLGSDSSNVIKPTAPPSTESPSKEI